MKEKIRVAVLYGGKSGEHEVSILSATNVIQQLDRNLFEIIPIGIDKQGSWYLGDDVFKKELNSPKLIALSRETERLLFNPDFIGKKIQNLPNALLTKSHASDKLFDVVFPVIHGTLCEDGTIQGLLELADVPYVGCGVLSSAVGMDKDISKRLIQNEGLHVPSFMVIKRREWERDTDACCQLIIKKMTFPCFIKPANTGSSVGVQKVKEASALTEAMQEAFRYDNKIIIEKAINAIELEIAVLESYNGNDEAFVSVVGEVRPTQQHEFYSYAAKYLDTNGAELIIPAPISTQLQKEVQDIAKKIFNALECEGMARVDLFLEKNTNKIYFNEINTIPGFTQISMYPKLMAASGISYKELLTKLIMLAIAKHDRKTKLTREYTNAIV